MCEKFSGVQCLLQATKGDLWSPLPATKALCYLCPVLGPVLLHQLNQALVFLCIGGERGGMLLDMTVVYVLNSCELSAALITVVQGWCARQYEREHPP